MTLEFWTLFKDLLKESTNMILFMNQTTQLALSVCFSVKLARKGQLSRNI